MTYSMTQEHAYGAYRLITAVKEMSTQVTYSDIAVFASSVVGIITYYSNGKLWNKSDPFQYKLYERPQLKGSSKTSLGNQIPDTRNIATKLAQLNKTGVIFWASQSGRAEAFAHRIERELSQRFNVQTFVADLSDYDHETLALIPETTFTLFLMSTYGEGDPPDNGWTFWDWINTTQQGSIRNLQFAAFGLGNSNYRSYNKVIDVVVDGLASGGAVELLETGHADDANNGTEEDFLQWKERLYRTLQKKYHLKEQEVQYQPTLVVTEHFGPEILDVQTTQKPIPSRSTSNTSAVVQVTVASMDLITSADSTKPCFHMEVDLSKHLQVKYKTGDHLVLWPTNPQSEVSRLLKVLNRSEPKNIILSVSSLDPSSSHTSLPEHTTLLNLLQHILEICAPVSRDTVQKLSHFSPSETIRSVLTSLASDRTSYANFVTTKHVTFARLIEYTLTIDPSANWSNLPLSFVVENIKQMTPRYYSISSSSSVSPRRASITFSDSSTILATNPPTTIPGLATSYLSSFSAITTDTPPVHLTIQLRRSDFKLPSSSSTPLILIAAGSGIAPIRAFLHERARLASIGRHSGLILLFFGCRHPDHDYLYRKEIEEFAAGPLSGKLQVITAFSRYKEKKTYVQERIVERGEQVAEMLVDHTASLYICGSTVMAKAAGDKVVEAVEAYHGFGGKRGNDWRAEMKRFRRWQEDVWG